IRDELANSPTITMAALQDWLKTTFGRDFHQTHIRELVGKVRNEITYEIDAAKIEPRLATRTTAWCRRDSCRSSNSQPIGQMPLVLAGSRSGIPNLIAHLIGLRQRLLNAGGDGKIA